MWDCFFSSTAVEKKIVPRRQSVRWDCHRAGGVPENQGGIADVYQTEIGYHLISFIYIIEYI